MIASFNRAIEMTTTRYLVMVTDDDTVDNEMLKDFRNIINNYPGHSIYVGCKRKNQPEKKIEIFNEHDYLFELLSPQKTEAILWSSCILETSTTKKMGGIPDFGSPHFADHALLAICGKEKGGLFINKIYGSLNSHDSNFSKSSFTLYYDGCIGFHNFITTNFKRDTYITPDTNSLERHIQNWFLKNYFILKKYFTYKKYNRETLKAINDFSEKIMGLSFMKSISRKFQFLKIIFLLKKPLFLIKYHRRLS